MFYKKAKNLIPYFFVLILLVGVFGLVSVKKVMANDPLDTGTCIISNLSYNSCVNDQKGTSSLPSTIQDKDHTMGTCTFTPGWSRKTCTTDRTSAGLTTGKFIEITPAPITSTTIGQCEGLSGEIHKNMAKYDCDAIKGKFSETNTPDASSETTNSPQTDYQTCLNNGGTPISCDDKSGSVSNPVSTTPLGKFLNLKENTCFFKDTSGTMAGCALQLSYIIFDQIPAFILFCAAYFFNFLISATLSSSMFSAPFVGNAWAVVRDLSNIFFILILNIFTRGYCDHSCHCILNIINCIFTFWYKFNNRLSLIIYLFNWYI